MIDIFDNLNTYSGAIGILFTIIGGVWGFLKFIDYLKHKSLELEDRRFITYHDLIKKLVQSDTPGEHIKLDRQIAVIYELRNFPEYFEVSKRILEGWKKEKADVNLPRLLEEIDISIKYMESNKIVRFFRNLFK